MLHPFLVWLLIVWLVLIDLDALRRLRVDMAPNPPAPKETRPKPPRPLRPHSPDDREGCREATQGKIPTPSASSPLLPWSQIKSRRGAPKRINTEGYACPNPDCRYHRVTDSRVHALIGYGQHGRAEPIADLFCQACHRKFTARRHPLLHRLKPSGARIALVLTALTEGLPLAGAVRTFDHTEATLTRWLHRAGEHAERLHERLFRNLQLLQVQQRNWKRTLGGDEETTISCARTVTAAVHVDPTGSQGKATHAHLWETHAGDGGARDGSSVKRSGAVELCAAHRRNIRPGGLIPCACRWKK